APRVVTFITLSSPFSHRRSWFVWRSAESRPAIPCPPQPKRHFGYGSQPAVGGPRISIWPSISVLPAKRPRRTRSALGAGLDGAQFAADAKVLSMRERRQSIDSPQSNRLDHHHRAARLRPGSRPPRHRGFPTRIVAEEWLATARAMASRHRHSRRARRPW